MTIKELSENVTITCRPGTKLPYGKQDEWQRSANGYSCTLEFQKRRMTVDFWMGTGLQGKPTASDVLSSLVSDSISIENSRSFEKLVRRSRLRLPLAKGREDLQSGPLPESKAREIPRPRVRGLPKRRT